MTDYLLHKKAIKGANSSFIFNKSVSKLIPYLLNEYKVLNIDWKKEMFMNLLKKKKKKWLYTCKSKIFHSCYL